MAQAKAGGKSDMDGWTNGVKYTDLIIVPNSYFTRTGGTTGYPNWKRTGYVPCDGAGSITFPPMTGASSANWNWFFDVNKAPVSNIQLSATATITVTVPTNAAYFGISNENASMDACINAGIIPHK